MNKTARYALALALAAPLAATADAPDPATGAFWYPDGRASHPAATPVATQSAAIATVPQISGAPAFDSGTGDVATATLVSEFSSYMPGTILYLR